MRCNFSLMRHCHGSDKAVGSEFDADMGRSGSDGDRVLPPFTPELSFFFLLSSFSASSIMHMSFPCVCVCVSPSLSLPVSCALFQG